MEFKSQICTSVEQSKRLLELGLKNETADMFYSRLSRSDQWNLAIGLPLGYDVLPSEYLIPAWSLHRLMEILMKGDKLGCITHNIHQNNVDSYYELVIASIEYLIKIDEFNKDYLEERK